MIEETTTAKCETMDKSGNSIPEFSSRPCGACKMLGYVLKGLDKNDPDFHISQTEFNKNEALKESLGVTGFPTLLFMHDGKEMSRLEGLKQKPAIVAEIDKLKDC